MIFHAKDANLLVLIQIQLRLILSLTQHGKLLDPQRVPPERLCAPMGLWGEMTAFSWGDLISEIRYKLNRLGARRTPHGDYRSISKTPRLPLTARYRQS